MEYLNTYNHKEEVNKVKTIKVGKTVPDGAVNLAYYFNKTSSLNGTISVMETDSNIITMHYKEEWIHERNLTSKDEKFFPDSIEFNGEKDTEWEGYWGILYRDFIDWEEATLKDINPTVQVVYEKFVGNTTYRLRNYRKFADGKKHGTLKLSTAYHEPLLFTKYEYPKLEGYDTSKFRYIPRSYRSLARYEGLVYNDHIVYHGTAKYSGIISKKDGLANVDPDEPREIIMYPNEEGVLETLNNKSLINDNLFYITDKFKDNVPLYYKHRLKYRIYDSVGPDEYGVYHSENIKIVTESNTAINENKYKYKIHLEETKWNNVYDVYIYTSFVPSVEKPFFVLYNGIPYDAYGDDNIINPFDVKMDIVEKLSVIQAFDIDKYDITENVSDSLQSTIKVKDFHIFDDTRKKIKVGYYIEVLGLNGETVIKTPVIEVDVINKKYALYSELDRFVNNEMIISEKDNDGFMTAKDIVLKYTDTQNHHLLNQENLAYRVMFGVNESVFGSSRDLVVLSTSPDGSGLVYAVTYEDTGFLGEDKGETGNRYNKELDKYSIYKTDGNKIYKGYSVLCRNINKITVEAPRDRVQLKGWYPIIKFAYFNKFYEKTDGTLKIVYTVPEYNYQDYGVFGKPYIDVKDEKPIVINKNMIKLSKVPLYIKTDNFWQPTNVVVSKVLYDGSKRTLPIKSFNFLKGIIELYDNITDNDVLLVDYTYEEQFYVYRGYYDNNKINTKMIDLNLNPNVYSHYIDTRSEFFSKKNTYNLFNKTIHFFLKPRRVIDMSKNNKVLVENSFSIYHKIDSQEADSPFDLHIGKIFVRHHASLKSTELIDTRVRGGGVIEDMKDSLRSELEPESDFYLDIGTIDGKAYHENSVIIVKIDNKVLEVNGGPFTEDEVKERVQKWAAYGCYPIVEFVDVLEDKETPNKTIIVNKHISNQRHIKPYFECSLIK